MIWNFETMYAVFSKTYQKQLLDGKWGVERELQRVTLKGDLALTPHPAAFGDKLMNKEITTDFAESQMELITPPLPSVEEVDRYLQHLHQVAEAGVGDEYLWPFSMPPRLPEEELIPIAQFDTSAQGQAAFIYRQGLANRYGKKMQMISGIHYNFSFGETLLGILHNEFGEGRNVTEFTDEIYFSVTRNFLRYRWLLIYLFGASPDFDGTYADIFQQEVKSIRKCCPECCGGYKEYATSLRVSRYGYSNKAQTGYATYYNNRAAYIQGIRSLMTKKSRRFAKLGVQLNDKILQKDSEFYAPIRLKQITKPGESQIDALERRGVEYVEVRILDINPFVRTGISLGQLRFLQVFMLYCLFNENSSIDNMEMKLINKNHHLAALSGRKPKLMLHHPELGQISLRTWGDDIFGKLNRIAKLLDEGTNNTYSLSVQEEWKKIMNQSYLPSALLREEMCRRKESFLETGMRIAKEYKSREEEQLG